MYSIVIRIAVGNFDISDLNLSLPWRDLITYMNLFAAFPSSQDNTKMAYLYIKLLVYCYLEVTIQAVKIAIRNNPNIQDNEKRELVLRFHRNSTAEKFISALFKQNVLKIRKADSDQLNEDEFSAYVISLSDEAKALYKNECWKLLFCFDEIQETLRYFPKLLIQEEVCDKSAYSQENPQRQLSSLFYGVSWVMSELSKSHGWCMYMTGTSYSITKPIFTKGQFRTAKRSQVSVVDLSQSKMNLENIQEILLHYWDIPDNVICNDEVVRLCRRLVGRPYLFVEGIFSPICQILRGKSEITVDDIISVLSESYSKLYMHFENRMELLFNRLLPLPMDTSKTINALIPGLIKSIICSDGKCLLDSDGVSEAILTGVVCVSAAKSNSVASNKTQLDVRNDEPMVCSVIEDYLFSILSKNDDSLFQSFQFIANSLNGDKGKRAEEMFVYYLSVKSYIYTRQHNCKKIPLLDLFKDLDLSNDNVQLRTLAQLYCKPLKIMNCKDESQERISLDLLIDHSSTELKYHDNIILFNVEDSMGLDIIFLASDDDDNNRLVGIQTKNSSSTLTDILKTINPGLQYLTNNQREYILKYHSNNKPAQPSILPHSGYTSSKNNEYVEFWRSHKSLCSDWIRVGLIARGINSAVYNYITEGFNADVNKKLTSVKSMLLGRGPIYSARQLAFDSSPIVFLSLSSNRWLTPAIRQQLEVDSEGEMCLPMNNSYKYWLPIDVDKVVEVLDKTR